MQDFTNINLDISGLPKMENLEYVALHKNYLLETILGRIIISIPVFVAIYITDLTDKNPYVFEFYVAAIIAFIAIVLLGYLGFYKKAYALREKDVSYKRGLIFNAITTVPLSRIQHSELVRGPLDRMLGLSSVKIYTAGGSSSDITIPGLTVKIAENLRAFINNKIATDENE